MKTCIKDKLRTFYSRFATEDRVLILINADPDSIASALAVKRLLWRKVQQIAISNVNKIDRPDNIAMVELLGITLSPIKEVDGVRFNRFVLVDSQPMHHAVFQSYPYDVIIDHHPDTRPEAGFKDIRPRYGATASILTEYLRAAKIKPSKKIATALILAIKTDTTNFERQTVTEDVRAFQYLFKHANRHLVRKIEQSELKPEYLKYFAYALEHRRMRKGRVYVFLGAVINPDICVIIADFFLKISSVKWSIVAGLYQKKLIVIFRNDGIRKDAGKVADSGFGQLGSAGGHKSMARAEIDLAALQPLVDVDNDKKMLSWIIARVGRKTGSVR